MDASAVQIERARRNVPQAHFIRADMTTVDRPLCAFDAVWAFYSITHIPRDEPGGLLKNHRWLAQVGCAIPRELRRHATERLRG